MINDKSKERKKIPHIFLSSIGMPERVEPFLLLYIIVHEGSYDFYNCIHPLSLLLLYILTGFFTVACTR